MPKSLGAYELLVQLGARKNFYLLQRNSATGALRIAQNGCSRLLSATGALKLATQAPAQRQSAQK